MLQLLQLASRTLLRLCAAGWTHQQRMGTCCCMRAWRHAQGGEWQQQQQLAGVRDAFPAAGQTGAAAGVCMEGVQGLVRVVSCTCQWLEA
jgi:hypothetical protein